MVITYWHGNHSVYSQWNECICDMLELLSLHRRIAHAYSVFLKYQVATVVIWLVWVSWKCSMGFSSSWPKVSVFSLPFEIVSYSVLTPDADTHTYTLFFQAFPSMSQNFTMSKIKTSLQEKKTVAASRIYASISISFICRDSHISLLQSAKQYHGKRKWLFFSSWKNKWGSTAEKCPSFSLPISWHQRNKAKRVKRLKETHINIPFFFFFFL